MKQLLRVQRSFESKVGEPRHLFWPCCEQFVTLVYGLSLRFIFFRFKLRGQIGGCWGPFFDPKFFIPPPLVGDAEDWSMLPVPVSQQFLILWFFFLIKWGPLFYLALCPFSVDRSKGNLTGYILLSPQSFTFSSCLHPRMRETNSRLSVAIKYTYRFCMMLLQWKVEKEEGVLVSALGSFVRRSIQKHKEEDNGVRLCCGLPSWTCAGWAVSTPSNSEIWSHSSWPRNNSSEWIY